MAQECDGPVRDPATSVCPLNCRVRRGTASGDLPGDRASARDEVDWAGLPINLDLVFSQQQRDKVYAQHLMRMRGAQLWRWLPHGAQLCVCERAADEADLGPDAA